MIHVRRTPARRTCAQARSQNFTLGATEAARVHIFLKKDDNLVFIVALKTPYFGIFGPTSQQSRFFPVKIHSIDD